MVTRTNVVDFLLRSILVAILYLLFDVVGPSGSQGLVIGLLDFIHGL